MIAEVLSKNEAKFGAKPAAQIVGFNAMCAADSTIVLEQFRHCDLEVLLSKLFNCYLEYTFKYPHFSYYEQYISTEPKTFT